jgi:hypothetical protein
MLYDPMTESGFCHPRSTLFTITADIFLNELYLSVVRAALRMPKLTSMCPDAYADRDTRSATYSWKGERQHLGGQNLNTVP